MKILDEDFGANVVMTVRFERSQVEIFRGALQERTQGQIRPDDAGRTRERYFSVVGQEGK